jgi:hypothetical protein
MIGTFVVTPGAKRARVFLELRGELAAIRAMTQSKENKGRDTAVFLAPQRVPSA